MNARSKLNTGYFYGSLFLALMIGAAAESVMIFLVALTVLVGASIYYQGIRFKPPGR